ncbi:MAG: Stage III sporulation protein SpoIIIAA [Chloroflexi bacterium]|nr:MAG: Stage III sporulation protein SpoIIIAA [Chloroflexota bacterium]
MSTINREGLKTLGEEDLVSLLSVMPDRLLDALQNRDDFGDLLEIVMDVGRPPEARFLGGDIFLSEQEISEDDLRYVTERIGEFGQDNRAGIERTLHRISAIRNRDGKVIGITCRVGRAVFGTIKPVEELVRSGKSVLLLGRPGVGKTTMLREVSRILADDAQRRVIVVDTSNEIAGDGDIPHRAIGHARRMQVPTPALQHDVMIEAVENHMPEVIIVDEMGTELETAAARTIAERGVQLIATAHGNTLQNLIMNPTLSDLVGGLESVILGDDEARRRRTQKTILERKRPPTFDSVVEIKTWGEVAIHYDVASVVDVMLRDLQPRPEVRKADSLGRGELEERAVFFLSNGTKDSKFETSRSSFRKNVPDDQETSVSAETIFICPFGINRSFIQELATRAVATIMLTDNIEQADVLLTTRIHYRRNAKLVKSAQDLGVPIHVLRKNTKLQIQQFLSGFGKGSSRKLAYSKPASLEYAMQEAQDAVEKVWDGEPYIELEPQRPFIRRQQHELANRYNVASQSVGVEPERRITVFRR